MAFDHERAAPRARDQTPAGANHAIDRATVLVDVNVGSVSKPSDDFERFVAGVRSRVDGLAAAWLSARMAEVAAHGAEVEAAADAVRSLVLRGGKRMRA